MNRFQVIGIALISMIVLGSAMASTAVAAQYTEGGNPVELGNADGLSEIKNLLIEDMKGGAFGEAVDLLCSGYTLDEFDSPTILLVLSVWPLSGSDPGTGAVKIPCTVDAGICSEAEVEAIDLPWQLEATSTTRATIESGGSGAPGWKAICNKSVEDKCTGASTVGLKNVTEGLAINFDSTTNEKAANCTRGGAGQGLLEGEILLTNESAGGVFAVGEEWLSRTNVGGVPTRGQSICEFGAVTQKCQIEFKNITARSLAVVSGRLEGEKATERYAKVGVVGCTFNLALGSCTDEIELKKLETGKLNDYCLRVEDTATSEIRFTCLTLKM